MDDHVTEPVIAMDEGRRIVSGDVLGQPGDQSLHGGDRLGLRGAVLGGPARDLARDVVAGLAEVGQPHRPPVDQVKTRQHLVHRVVDPCSLGGRQAGEPRVGQDTTAHVLHDVEGRADHARVLAQRVAARHRDPGAGEARDHAVLAVDRMRRGEELAGGLAPEHVLLTARAEVVGRVRLAANELPHGEPSREARDVLAHVAVERLDVEAVRVPHLHRPCDRLQQLGHPVSSSRAPPTAGLYHDRPAQRHRPEDQRQQNTPARLVAYPAARIPSADHRFILDLVLPHTPPDDRPLRCRTQRIHSRSSGGARAEGEGDAHLVADGVQEGLIGDAVVAAVNDELAGGHQRRTGQVDVHRDGDLARDAVQGEPAQDGGAAAGALHAQALEGDRGELPDVEEVLAAQVVVAHPDSRVDGGRVDGERDLGGGEVLGVDHDLARQAVEPAVGVHEPRGRPEGHLARLRLYAEAEGVGPGGCAPRERGQREEQCRCNPAVGQWSGGRSPGREHAGRAHASQYRSRVNPSWRRARREIRQERPPSWCSLFGRAHPRWTFSSAVSSLASSRRPSPAGGDERIAALEEQVRGLLYRVWTLEQSAAVAPPDQPRAAAPDRPPAAPPPPPPPSLAPEPVAPAEPVEVLPPPAAAAEEPRPRPLDLEQRIGARWSTWVGVVAILFGIGFFLKWSFENDLLGPGARVVLGLVAGLGLLMSGLLLHRRRDVPHLSEGLAGLGLGVLYLSLYGAHAVYGLAGPGATFAGMFAVTLLGALVSVVSNRQITAVLTVLGGLLTPVLLTVERPDERNLLAYLLVLDLLALAVARFRTWPALGRLAWAGSALLFAAVLVREPDSPHPLSRLALVSALFVLFLALPLVQPLAERRRQAEIDLLLVAANAAGYFWAVYVTLEPWHPGAEGAYALALAIVYRLVSADYAARVPDDEATVVVHEGVAWTFLTLAIPLALGGRWVTLAWAAQGVVLLWSAARVQTPVAAWGGLAALLLAAARVVGVDRHA